MNPRTNPRRPLGLGAYVAMTVAVMVVGGVAGAASAIFGDGPGMGGLLVTVGLMIAAMAVAFAACKWWWAGIDEAAREAHKWAWWWGGTSGIAVGGVILLTLSLRADETTTLPAFLGASPADLFASGMMTILLFQLAGYALAWAGWWLKHR